MIPMLEEEQPDDTDKTDLPEEQAAAVRRRAAGERAEGRQVLVAQMLKNKKFQKDQLNAEGYAEIEEIYRQD